MLKWKSNIPVQVAWWSMFVCGRTFRYTTIWFRVIVLLFLNLVPRWITNAWSQRLFRIWEKHEGEFNPLGIPLKPPRTFSLLCEVHIFQKALICCRFWSQSHFARVSSTGLRWGFWPPLQSQLLETKMGEISCHDCRVLPSLPPGTQISRSVNWLL